MDSDFGVGAHDGRIWREKRRGKWVVYVGERQQITQLRVRQHFKLDLCRIGRACLVVRSEQPSLELPQGEVDDGHQDS